MESEDRRLLFLEMTSGGQCPLWPGRKTCCVQGMGFLLKVEGENKKPPVPQ